MERGAAPVPGQRDRLARLYGIGLRVFVAVFGLLTLLVLRSRESSRSGARNGSKGPVRRPRELTFIPCALVAS